MNLFTTEAVTKFHPDKYADQISDAILDAYLKKDRNSRCAIETTVKDDFVVVAGEVRSSAVVDVEQVVRTVAQKLGYEVGSVINLLGGQTDEIGQAVQGSGELCAGDQGVMYGYACGGTTSMLHPAFELANRMVLRVEDDVENDPFTPLKGDAKVQVTMDMDSGQVLSVVISACHHASCQLQELRTYVRSMMEDLVQPVEWIINPAGTWTVGGPKADCGMTGRKIVSDQYGGAFSGKDPTKVDRTATYMARVIACELTKMFDLGYCAVQLAYVIGRRFPVSLSVSNDRDIDLMEYVCCHYDLSVEGMIRYLNMYDMNFESLAEGCHFFDKEAALMEDYGVDDDDDDGEEAE